MTISVLPVVCVLKEILTEMLHLKEYLAELTLDPGAPPAPGIPDSPVAPWPPAGPLAPRSPGAPCNTDGEESWVCELSYLQFTDSVMVLVG